MGGLWGMTESEICFCFWCNQCVRAASSYTECRYGVRHRSENCIFSFCSRAAALIFNIVIFEIRLKLRISFFIFFLSISMSSSFSI